MSDESKSTPAPAAEKPSEPAFVPPAPDVGVDLSDLQAELDATAAKAEEDDIFADIENTGTKDAKSDDEGDDQADAGDETDEGEDEEKAGDESADGDKPKKRSRADRYRDRITRLEHENAELRSRAGGSPSRTQIEQDVLARIGPEPQEKDFDDYLTYDREHTAWLIDKRQSTRDIERHYTAAQQERGRRMAENVEQHKERVEQFRNRDGEASAKDFDEYMAKAKDLPVAPHVEELILESGKSAHLQYFFARNPQRLDKLNRMSEREAAREVGQIEARLSLPQPKVKTAAPPPPRTPKGGAAPASQEAELNNWLNKKYGSQ